jgi:hypothetical protein
MALPPPIGAFRDEDRIIADDWLERPAGRRVAPKGFGFLDKYFANQSRLADPRTGRLKTAGLMEYSAPQIAGRDEPFRSVIREHLKGHTQGLEDLAIEMLARGLSVRDIEDAQGREWPPSAVQDRSVAAWRTSAGGLSGVRPAGLERVRDQLSIYRRHKQSALLNDERALQISSFSLIPPLAVGLALSGCATGQTPLASSEAPPPSAGVSVGQRDLTPEEKKVIMDAVAQSLRNPESLCRV